MAITQSDILYTVLYNTTVVKPYMHAGGRYTSAVIQMKVNYVTVGND